MSSYSAVSSYIADAERRLAVTSRRLSLRLRPGARARNPGHALARLPPDPTVLVLCYGNICRSPLAERYLANRLAERGVDGVTVDSAGFFEASGRSSPETAFRAALRYGVDLSSHRSKPVTPGLFADADVVFLMDAQNYQFALSRFPDEAGKTCFLRSLVDDDAFEISDPYDGDLDEFVRVYDEVVEAVDALVDALAADASN